MIVAYPQELIAPQPIMERRKMRAQYREMCTKIEAPLVAELLLEGHCLNYVLYGIDAAPLFSLA
jgi:hypothetical protein